MNPYETLGVPEDATDAEIKAAYKSLAQKHHPDRKGGDEGTFKRVSEAYRNLSDRDDPVDVMLTELFQALVSNDQFQGDLANEARRIIDQAIDRAEVQLREMENAVTRLSHRRARLDNPIFLEVVDDRLRGIDTSIARVTKELVTAKQVRERLEGLKDNNPDMVWSAATNLGGTL